MEGITNAEPLVQLEDAVDPVIEPHVPLGGVLGEERVDEERQDLRVGTLAPFLDPGSLLL
jgi:hypothetical protein